MYSGEGGGEKGASLVQEAPHGIAATAAVQGSLGRAAMPLALTQRAG